ncbi:MAG: hypothetical protein IT437_06470 [Phycisphaerales bacterium]|nr:hypothetical protein [Phycisphaerales bacterium]
MSRRWIAAALLAFAAGAAADVAPPPGVHDLQNVYPGARAYMEGSRVRVLYGVPMTMGMTPDQAATQFWSAHAAAFGVGALELNLTGITTVQNGRFTVYQYTQSISGMPVEHGVGRLMVLNQPVPRVVYAAGTFARVPAGGFGDAFFTGAQVAGAIKRNPQYADLTTWTAPVAAVYQDDAGVGTRVWRFEGWRPGRGFTFFVDMTTGLLLRARSEVYNDDVTGTVKAMATPGLKPDIATNVPVAIAVSQALMKVTGGNSAYSNTSGNFTIPNAGTAPVTLTSSAQDGRWVQVFPTGTATIQVSLPGTVPGVPASPLFNAVPGGTNSQTTAQANVLIHGQLIHDYYTDRAPSFSLPAIHGNTGVSGTCNAYYFSSDDSINFFNVGGGCNNSAYSSVIAHEYGHYVVNTLGLSQGAFGEGFGDTSAVMLYDTGIIADTFFQNGQPIRDLINNTRSYPCNGEFHDCGEVEGAFWYRVLQNFKASYGTQPGWSNAQELQVAWSQMTTGGSGSNSLHPASIIEVLTVDDTDGNLTNGTPNYADICAASATRNLPCPPLTPFEFQYPNGHPEIITSNQPTVIQVNLVGVASTPVPGTGTISYSINGGSIVTNPMTEVTPNHYEATIPATQCTDTVDYYFTAQAASGATVRDPQGAPATKFHAVSAVGSTIAANFNFETDPGWTVTNSTGLAAGAWQRGVPSTPNTQYSPPTDGDGSGQCWVTGLAPNQDVDGGTTVLTTSAMDLSGYDSATLSYDRWFETLAPAPPNTNYRVLVVQISANDGLNWSTLEFPAADPPKAWVHKEFQVTNVLPLTSAMRVRFSVSDDPNTWDVEAGIDAFKVVAYTCTSQCYADCNGDGVLNLADFGCFQTKFATGDPYADCNGDGTRNLADFGCFTTKFALGCP